MNAKPDRHWTEDEELLSRYVLGRVPPAGSKELERHLAACPACRASVERERVLAAGIRRAGRDDLRARLAEHLRAGHRTAVPWPRVLAAAAVLLVITGVLVVPRWLAVRTETPVETTGLHEAPPEPVPPATTAQPPTEPRTREEVAPTQPAPPSGGYTPSTSGRRVAAGSTGRVAAPRVLFATMLQPGAPAAQMRMKERAEADAVVAQAEEFSTPAGVPIVVTRSAPPAEAEAAPDGPGTIPCRYEERGDTVIITVLHSPQGEDPAAGPPQVRRIGPDSLVIRFPDLHLGLKLPPRGPDGSGHLK